MAGERARQCAAAAMAGEHVCGSGGDGRPTHAQQRHSLGHVRIRYVASPLIVHTVTRRAIKSEGAARLGAPYAVMQHALLVVAGREPRVTQRLLEAQLVDPARIVDEAAQTDGAVADAQLLREVGDRGVREPGEARARPWRDAEVADPPARHVASVIEDKRRPVERVRAGARARLRVARARRREGAAVEKGEA